MNIRDALTLRAALFALQSIEDLDISPGTRWRGIFQNLSNLDGLQKTFDAAKTSIVRKYADGKESIENTHPQFSQCTQEIDALLDQEAEIAPLNPLTAADLGLEEKQIDNAKGKSGAWLKKFPPQYASALIAFINQ